MNFGKIGKKEMEVRNRMPKILSLSLEDEDLLCELAASLSSPARIQTLKLLYFNSYSVGEIAEKLNIPYSSASLYVKSLENVGLIKTKTLQGSRGAKKICSRNHNAISIRLNKTDDSVDKVSTISMPIGCYTKCEIVPGCGIVSEAGYLAPDDRPEMFFMPNHVFAQLIWSKTGFVEYQFPYLLTPKDKPKGLQLSFEVCSEFYNYNEDWPSDITIWINGTECGTWRCPSDYGARRGRLNPEWWSSGCTQYGKLLILELSETGCLLNGTPVPNLTIHQFHFSANAPITIRIGNKPDAEYPGGFNIFGKKFGDFEQDIVLSITYASES